RSNFRIAALGARLLRVPQVIAVLQVQPELRGRAGQIREPERRVRRDATVAPNQLIETHRGDVHPRRGVDLRHRRIVRVEAEPNVRSGRNWRNQGRDEGLRKPRSWSPDLLTGLAESDREPLLI